MADAADADAALMEAVVAERADRVRPDTHAPQLFQTTARSHDWKVTAAHGSSAAAGAGDSATGDSGGVVDSFIAPGVAAELFEKEREGLLQLRALLEREGVREWRDPESDSEVDDDEAHSSSGKKEAKADHKLRAKDRAERRQKRAAEVPILLPFDPLEDLEALQAVLQGEDYQAGGEIKWASERLDRFLCACLFARKFNLTRTLELLRKNTEWRREWGCEHGWPTFESVKGVLEKMEMLYLVPGARSVRGGGIMYLELAKHVPKEALFTVQEWMEYNKFFAAQGPIMHGLDSQRNGAVFIEDLSGVGLKNLGIGTEFTGKEAQKMQNSLQDCFPMRIQSILILNAPGILKVMLRLAKSMGVKKKILNRVHNLKNPDDLFEHVDKSQLPVNYGGELEYDHAKFVEAMCAWSEEWESRIPEMN